MLLSLITVPIHVNLGLRVYDMSKMDRLRKKLKFRSLQHHFFNSLFLDFDKMATS